MTVSPFYEEWKYEAQLLQGNCSDLAPWDAAKLADLQGVGDTGSPPGTCCEWPPRPSFLPLHCGGLDKRSAQVPPGAGLL